MLALLATSTAQCDDKPAHVDDKDEARALFVAAKELGEKGLWEEAAKLWERSLGRYRAPLTLYSLGLAESKIGRLLEAREHLQAFLDAPPSPKSKEVEPEARRLLESLATRIPTVVIVVMPSTGVAPTLVLDGKEVRLGATGRIELNPGSHELEARAAGWLDVRTTTSVVEGESRPITLSLEPAPHPTEPLAPATALPAPAAPNLSAMPPARSASSARRTASFTLMGVGGAMLGVGVGVGLAGVAQAHAASARAGADADAARTKALAGDVLVGGGVAAAAIGLVLILTGDRDVGGGGGVSWSPEGVSVRFF